MIDRKFDGILGIKLKNCSSDFEFIVFACYLPPEYSNRGRDAQGFYTHLLTQIYLNCESDAIFVMGDLNSRIGNSNDILQDIDHVPNRRAIDNTVNQHGHELIDFLNEANFCVLNGRFQDDNFTCISRKGKSVVDYICVPIDVFRRIKNFTVLTIQNIVAEFGLLKFVGEKSKLPDHSVIMCEFNLSECCLVSSTPKSEYCQNRFQFNRIPNDFMSSELRRSALIATIDLIENSRKTQESIDEIYEQLCEIIHNEMESKLPKVKPRSNNKRFKNSKPYWTDQLTDLWNATRETENNFIRYKGERKVKSALRREYTEARDLFDKTLRRAERNYKKSFANVIEDMSSTNPNEFWNKIRKLGPRNKHNIPMEVLDDEGNVIANDREILERWRVDFENLYNGCGSTEFDNVHYNETKSDKDIRERRMEEESYQCNEEINYDVSFQEISDIVMRAKSNSACGIDEIPYSVLKYPVVINTIRSLFQHIFDTSLIPSVWRKAIICPILKDPSSDKRVPMNYRGVSLLPCISKLYSSFINKRIMSYLENNDILADEQNGFRKDRSCEDHLFTLNSLVQNNKNLYVAFIDLQKCFDFVDRDMMLYKLLLHNIDGKVYNSIKNIYQSSESCVRVNNKLTNWFRCKTGVKQGDNLSPTLFSIFINDLVQDINNLNLGIELVDRKLSILLYADDIALIAKSPEDLQSMLDKLHSWCRRWRVLINTNKSKCVHFNKTRSRAANFEFTIGLNKLETVENYKYLGITFTHTGNFMKNAENLAKAGGRALGKIISSIHSNKDFRFNAYEKLFYSCVIPVLDYASSVWGYKKFQPIDNIQNRAIRYFIGVHRFAPTLGVYGDTGWIPSQYRRWINIIIYWNRVLSFGNDRITRIAF